MDIVPDDSSRRNLKRPRQGSLDAEEHLPPPKRRNVGSRSQIRLDMHHQTPSSWETSSATTGTNIEDVQLRAPLHHFDESSEDVVLASAESPHPISDMASRFALPTAMPHRLPAENRLYHQAFLDIPNYYIRRAPIGAFPSQMSGSHRPHPSITQICSHSSQTNITGGTHIENHGNFTLYQQTAPTADPLCSAQLLEHAAPNAIHTSSAVENQGICTPGTRAFTLQHLQSLVSSIGDGDPDVIWLVGPAGSGKSAIMRTMARALEEQNVLLGSFFFFRSDHSRNTSTRFGPTMALQTFASFPTTKPHIRNGIESQPTIFFQSTRRQVHTLVEIPLKLSAGHEPKWTAQSPLVIVIDGIDECAEADRQGEIIKAVQKLAFSVRSSTNHRVKVLIASRSEVPIADEFELDKDSVAIIKLDPSDANIDLFYDTQLDQLRRRKSLPESWPSLTQITWLKKKTRGQYLFAKTSMGFLAGDDPIERFKMLEKGVGTYGLEQFDVLDLLFRRIPPEMASDSLFLTCLGPNNFSGPLEHILASPSALSSRSLHYLSSVVFNLLFSYHANLHAFFGIPLRPQMLSLCLGIPLRLLSLSLDSVPL